jgi:N-acetylglutamate synthase-like GNAT family acetyltransferase
MQWRVETVPLDDGEAFDDIEEFCTEAGLPFFIPDMDNLLKQFVIKDADGELAAAGRLEMNYGHPMVEEIAVRKDLRRNGLGKKIVDAILTEARARNIETIWVMARAPELFRSLGFKPADDKELIAQLKEECAVCRDHITVCNPILMKKRLL